MNPINRVEKNIVIWQIANQALLIDKLIIVTVCNTLNYWRHK